MNTDIYRHVLEILEILGIPFIAVAIPCTIGNSRVSSSISPITLVHRMDPMGRIGLRIDLSEFPGATHAPAGSPREVQEAWARARVFPLPHTVLIPNSRNDDRF